MPLTILTSKALSLLTCPAGPVRPHPGRASRRDPGAVTSAASESPETILTVLVARPADTRRDRPISLHRHLIQPRTGVEGAILTSVSGFRRHPGSGRRLHDGPY